jgi:predicted NBD/HSP70 family sugar kinase
MERVLCNNDSGLAAIAEYLWGRGSDIRGNKDSEQHNMAYFKIREGIGSGVVLAGRIWQGARQPEMGHIPIRRAKNDDYPGLCPYHDDCVEGLASRPAMIQRLSAYSGDAKVSSLKELDSKENHEIWQLEGYYLGELALIADLVVAPQKIIFEGDVIRPHLLNKIRASYKESAAQYPKENKVNSDPNFISAGEFRGTDATLLGALELSRQNAIAVASKVGRRVIEGGKLRYELDKNSAFEKSITSLKRQRNDSLGLTSARDPITTYHAPESKWVFGLSITETIEWVIGQATDGKLDKGYESGILCPDVPPGLMPINANKPIYLQQHLQEGLQRLHAKRPDLFSRKIEGIGVSAIGVVDQKRQTLESIARKAWEPLRKNKPIVDFGELFHVQDNNGDLIFPADTIRNRLSVQNDAPARCLTEYMYGFEGKARPESLLYLMIGEGVNGAVLSDGDLPHTVGHPEFGHCLPLLHDFDVAHDPTEYTGCPAHTTCFEGLASNARIRRQYGWTVSGLKGEELEKALEIASFYITQLVLNGVMMFNPHNVLLGGGIMQGPKGLLLLDKIRHQFKLRNSDYLPDYKTPTNIQKLIQRANFGDEVRPLSAFMVGSLVAFGGKKFGKALTVKELSRRAELWADG